MILGKRFPSLLDYRRRERDICKLLSELRADPKFVKLLEQVAAFRAQELALSNVQKMSDPFAVGCLKGRIEGLSWFLEQPDKLALRVEELDAEIDRMQTQEEDMARPMHERMIDATNPRGAR
jgi:hypothetical protein